MKLHSMAEKPSTRVSNLMSATPIMKKHRYQKGSFVNSSVMRYGLGNERVIMTSKAAQKMTDTNLCRAGLSRFSAATFSGLWMSISGSMIGTRSAAMI